MATTRTPKNRRGSPEAIEKRRAARAFNQLLAGKVKATKVDGRTEKRRARLLDELGEGTARGGRALKPIDVLSRVEELLSLGETVASIKKVRRIPRPLRTDPDKVELVKRLHAAYGFHPEVYRFVGFGEDALVKAGLVEKAPRSPAKPRKAKARK